MKTRSLFFAGIVAGLLSSPAGATTLELFHETFDGNNQNWSYTSTGGRSYDKTWTESGTVKPGYKGIKLGSTSATGAIMSGIFGLDDTSVDVVISVVAAAYSNNGGGQEGILVTAYDSSENEIFSESVAKLTQHASTAKDEIPATDAFTHSFTIPASSLPANGGIKIKIESTYTLAGQRRALLGDVLVSQFFNQAPSASQASESVAATVGIAVSLDLSDYFSDADGDALTYAVASGVGTVSGSTWTYTPAAAGSYSAVVSATDPYGASATMSIAVTAEEPQLPILDTPTGLVDSNVSFTSFGLSWNAVSGADGYVVTLSPADGSVVVSGTSATASGLTEGTTYTVNVVATGAGAINSAAASLEVQTLVHVQLAAPAGLASSSVTDSGFTLSWSAVANAANYSVSVLDGNDAAAGTVSVSGTTATVTGLSSDTAYTAKVKALAPTGDTPYLDSGWSDTVFVTTELADGLKRAVLLDEGFSGSDNAWNNTSAKPGDAETDCDSWSFSTIVYNARSSIKIGQTGTTGWALSPEITLSNEVASANVVLSFSAAAYPAKSTKFSVSLVNSATGETNAVPSLTALSPTALKATSETDLSSGTNYVEEIVAPTRFKLLFETISSASDKRLLLDSIKVTQIYDPAFAALPAPTGVEATDVGKFGFTVSWTGVANASGYEVLLDGATVGSCASTDTSKELTGLSDGTTYSVQVRALGDNLHYGDSPLSTAISATTVEDVQKIDFTVTGAPTGDVYAGNAVSFTVTAENEATHAAAEVSFSGIADATFSNGTFSWTPAESDVGSHVATFTSGAYSTNVSITVVSAFKSEPLFRETFTNVGDYSWGATTDLVFPTRTTATDNDLWSGTNCIVANYAIRLGKASVFGHATTPVIETKGGGPAELTLAFRCARTSGSGRVAVTVADLSGQTIYAVTNTPISETVSGHNAIGAEHGMTNMFAFAAGGAFTVTFAPLDDGRVGIDEIEVFQTVPAASETVALETVHSSATSDAKVNGFTATWGAVANAEGYSVMVFDRNGACVPGATASIDSANCRAVITGLSPASRYYVKVKALGDGSATWDSAWSAASLADTPIPPTVISVW